MNNPFNAAERDALRRLNARLAAEQRANEEANIGGWWIAFTYFAIALGCYVMTL